MIDAEHRPIVRAYLAILIVGLGLCALLHRLPGGSGLNPLRGMALLWVAYPLWVGYRAWGHVNGHVHVEDICPQDSQPDTDPFERVKSYTTCVAECDRPVQLLRCHTGTASSRLTI